MLVALVSTIDARDDLGRFLTVGGQSVVGHQVAAALALGCESVICLVDERESRGDSAEVTKLRRQVTDGGAGFHLASDIFGVSSKVTARDALIVFADGVLPQQTLCHEVAAERPGIAAYRSPGGETTALERINPEFLWGGIFRAPGDIVERFASVAPDGDPVSGLLRTALQNGVRLVELADAEAPVVIRTPEQAKAETDRWRRRRLGKADWRVPGEAIAISLALRHDGASGVQNRPWTHPLASYLPLAPYFLAAIAILVAWAGWPVLAFLALGASSVLRLLSLRFEIEPPVRTAGSIASLYPALFFDAAVLTVSYFALLAENPASQILPAGLAIIAAILALPWLAIRHAIPLWQTVARDRFALCIGLAMGALAESFATAAAILLIVILAAMLIFPRSPGLTRS